ncbi:MAG: GNAT family N-acetyltransferase [Acholeplasmataceae bacterium]|jgi:RimJ/RimL family protein N-acetyltransferase
MHIDFEIKGKSIKLRQFKESDIDDVIRWMTIDTEWFNWDAPWEDSSNFNPKTYKKEKLKKLRNQKEVPNFYHRLEIEVLDTLEHIGWVSSYYIDDNYQFISNQGYLTIGIDICHPKHRKQGFGTEAWVLYIDYALSKGYQQIYTQTWSGNYLVQALIEKLGFELINVNKNYQIVNDKYVDGYTYLLNINKFEKIKQEI